MGVEVYSYAGVDLSTVGALMEVVDGIDSAPPIRASSGGNLIIPYQHGRRWIQKYYDERVIVLKGTIFSQSGGRADYEAKVDALKQLFPIGAGEQKLLVTRDAQLRYIMAEVRNTLGLERTAAWVGLGSKFSIELVASDPLWYGSALEASQSRPAWTFDSGIFFDDGGHWFDQTSQYFSQIITGPQSNVEASNAGTAPIRKLQISLSGQMFNPVITHLRSRLSVQVLGSFTPANQVLIDCGLQQAFVDGASVQPSQIVLGSGQTDWMVLAPGDNTLQIGIGIATGRAAYRALYSAAYL